MINVILFYRIERWFYLHHLKFLAKVIQLWIFWFYNTKLSGTVSIGKKTFFACGGISCSVHDNAVIGDNCRLGIHFVLVGQSPYKNVAKIGNNVWIGPNVVIQGPVVIEDGVVIAPGSIVNKSVPQNAIIAGTPAKVIGFTTELQYDIMKNESYKEGYRPFLTDNRDTINLK